ncbi:MAG: hypothetical protein LBQ12_04570 [Deltaproteobacteria bacterium]|jgi:hypothetical protein|nr:hypothetical protein [Deltaproteobacteria bacterium]
MPGRWFSPAMKWWPYGVMMEKDPANAVRGSPRARQALPGMKGQSLAGMSA